MTGPPPHEPAPPPQTAPPPPQGGPPYTPYPQYGYPGYPAQPYIPPQGNGLGIAGGVLGIVALVLFWIPYLGAVLGALAVIFGALGVQRANRLPGAPTKGFAIAGLVCGIIAVALDIIFIILIYASVGSFHISGGTGAPIPTSAS